MTKLRKRGQAELNSKLPNNW